ncbi:MAG TPA: hypothetical protein VGI60_05850 [Chthoniobacterales bacterium]|jgi:hypothetical protein
MKKNHLTKSLAISNSRWVAYATAGAATVFGAAAPAEAEIHYSGVLNIHFNRNEPLPSKMGREFDLDHARMFFGRDSYGAQYVNDKFGLIGIVSNQIRGHSFLDISRLQSGEPVSQGAFYQLDSFHYALMVGLYGSGNFRHSGEAFIGFKFNSGDGPQYGWARVIMSGIRKNSKFILVDYAWGDVGDSINTGQTSSAASLADVRPGTGSLGVLAFGAVGLLAWRKQRCRGQMVPVSAAH